VYTTAAAMLCCCLLGARMLAEPSDARGIARDKAKDVAVELAPIAPRVNPTGGEEGAGGGSMWARDGADASLQLQRGGHSKSGGSGETSLSAGLLLRAER